MLPLSLRANENLGLIFPNDCIKASTPYFQAVSSSLWTLVPILPSSVTLPSRVGFRAQLCQEPSGACCCRLWTHGVAVGTLSCMISQARSVGPNLGRDFWEFLRMSLTLRPPPPPPVWLKALWAQSPEVVHESSALSAGILVPPPGAHLIPGRLVGGLGLVPAPHSSGTLYLLSVDLPLRSAGGRGAPRPLFYSRGDH